MKPNKFLAVAVSALCLGYAAHAAPAAAAANWPTLQPARQVANATAAPILAAAWAGKRLVAVGDQGVILLSDDGGAFRQAKAVPVRSLLTTVQFVDERRGYAAGHDGVVLGTEDGGQTWTLLRAQPGKEQPVLAIHFDTPQHGIAVGPYGWAIETQDAGKTWSDLRIQSSGTGDGADRHLLHLFASGSGALFIAGEGGAIFRSADKGQSWQDVSTGNKCSLWYGAALADGTLMVCGMRGHLYRSDDDGKSWQAVASHTTQSLTGMAQLADGKVIVVGMGGTVLESQDGGKSFKATVRPEQEALTAVMSSAARPVLLSMNGPLPNTPPAKQ